jgi:hypothetical protein
MLHSVADEVAVEADRAAAGILRRFGRDALVIVLHARRRADSLGLAAEALAWRRVQAAIAAQLEVQADRAWIEGRPTRSALSTMTWLLQSRPGP